MAKYRLVPAAEWDKVIGTLRRALAVLENVGHAGTLELPRTPAQPDRVGGPTLALASEGARPYVIGRGSWSYVDVWLKEMPEDLAEFSLDQAWATIRDLVEVKGKRPRDGLRIALDRDERFARIQDRQGVWWRYGIS